MPQDSLLRYRFNTFGSIIVHLDILLFCWAWTNLSFTRAYNFQLIGLLVFFYILYHLFWEKKLLEKTESGVLNVKSYTLTAIILLFISSTGGLSSPFFFLIYFLCIGIALLLKPLVATVLIFGLIGYFFSDLYTGEFYDNIIKLISLFMVVPLALFFAHGFLKSEEQDQKILIFNKSQKVYQSELEKIQDNIALWTSFKLKGPLSVVKHYAYSLLHDKKVNLEQKQKDYLTKIYSSNEQALECIDEFEKTSEEAIEELQSKIKADKFKQDVILDA